MRPLIDIIFILFADHVIIVRSAAWVRCDEVDSQRGDILFLDGAAFAGCRAASTGHPDLSEGSVRPKQEALPVTIQVTA
jgi:hypothetical protein